MGTFHASKSASRIPGIETILKSNPEVMTKIESTIAQKVVGPPPKSAEQIKKEAEFKLYQEMMAKRAKEQEILNNIKKTTNLEEVKATIPLETEKNISISNINPTKSRVEVTETLNSESLSLSSINSEKINMIQNKKTRLIVNN